MKIIEKPWFFRSNAECPNEKEPDKCWLVKGPLSDTFLLILLRKLRKEHCYRCRDLGEISPADRADLIKRPWQQQLARAAVRLNVTLVINRTVLIFVVLKKKHVTDHDGIVVLTETRCLGTGVMETFR